MLKLTPRQSLKALVVSAVVGLSLALATACTVYDYDEDYGHRNQPPAAHKAPPHGPAPKAPPPRSPDRNDRYHSIVTGPGPSSDGHPAPRPR